MAGCRGLEKWGLGLACQKEAISCSPIPIPLLPPDPQTNKQTNPKPPTVTKSLHS